MLQNLIKKIETVSKTKLQLTIVFLGILIAAYIQYIQHGWINPDSTIYFESARLFALGEWKAAYEVFQWPVYAFLIAIIHKLTYLNIQTSAQILSIVFFGIATASFIQILNLANRKNLVLICGALILFSAQYIVGDVLGMLLRDEGFWAFFLSSLVFFIYYAQTHKIQHALLWQVCIILATLFRVEGISYLIGLPITLFFLNANTKSSRFYIYLKANSLNILIITCIFASILLSPQLTMKSFGRLNEVLTLNLYNELTSQLFSKADVMSKLVLGHYLSDYALSGIIITFLYAMTIKTFAATGYVNMALAYLSVKHHSQLINPTIFRILKITAIISIVNMALIITKVFVLSGRYVVPLAFVLMIFASLYFAKFIEDNVKIRQNNPTKVNKKQWIIYGLLILMLLGVVKNILPKKPGYNFRQEAITWLKQNNPENKPVFYDEPRLRYYANEKFIGSWGDTWQEVKTKIDDNTINQYDYLVIHLSSRHPDRIKEIKEALPQYSEVKRFDDYKAKKSVAIYKKTNE
jgi:hypothetical protein